MAALNEALARRVEESGLNSHHTRRQLIYDGWLVFLVPGKAKRARSVNAHFGSTLPIADKIARCERLYEKHGLPVLFRITPFSQPAALDAELGARGYVHFDTTLVQVATLSQVPQYNDNVDVAIDMPLIDGFVDTVGAMRGSPLAQRSAHLERLAQTPLDVHAVIARRDGIALGAGLLSIDGELAGVFDMLTLTASQGQGVGGAVLAALLARAWERNVRQVFLQVTADNAPAIAVYRKFGFATVFAYHYRGRANEDPDGVGDFAG